MRSRGAKEVSWSVPDGFEVANEPSKYRPSSMTAWLAAVCACIHVRWEKYGWQLGRITDTVTNATPRGFKNLNYRIIWADGTQKGPAKLSVENYGHASDARYNSWAIVSRRSIPAV